MTNCRHAYMLRLLGQKGLVADVLKNSKVVRPCHVPAFELIPLGS